MFDTILSESCREGETEGWLTWTRVVFHIETDVSALDMSQLERNRAKQRELSAGTVPANLSH